MHGRHQLRSKPAAVGRPHHHHLVILAGISAPVGQTAHRTGSQIHHVDFIAVADKCHLLAVGRYYRVGIFSCRISQFFPTLHIEHRLLLDSCSIGKIRVILTAKRGAVDILMSRTFRRVVKCAVVVTPAQMTLGGRSIGNLHRGGIFHRGDKHIATADECH